MTVKAGQRLALLGLDYVRGVMFAAFTGAVAGRLGKPLDEKMLKNLLLEHLFMCYRMQYWVKIN